jgi:hypothetical protein
MTQSMTDRYIPRQKSSSSRRIASGESRTKKPVVKRKSNISSVSKYASKNSKFDRESSIDEFKSPVKTMYNTKTGPLNRFS